MLQSSLCDHSDAYKLVKGDIPVAYMAAICAARNNNNEIVVFKNSA